MTDTDTLAHIEAVLAARRRGDTVSTSRYVELIHATYPEALAVVRLADSYAKHYGYPVRGIDGRLDELADAVAAYLAKAQEYVPAARDATEAGS